MGNAQRGRAHPFRWRLETVGISAAAGALQFLSEPSALALGAAVGRGFARLDTSGCRIARANIALVFPNWSSGEREDLLRTSFAELGRSAVEWARLSALSPREVSERVEIRGLAHLEKALADGRGTLIATAHYGSWELMRRAVAGALPELEITAVGRAQPNPYLQRMVSRRRNLDGSQPLAQDARSILRALRRNAAIGLLADHYLSPRRGGLLLPFLGTPAWSNPGPATLALRTGCPLLLAHTHRLGGNRHRIELEPRLELPTRGERQANISVLTARINQDIGRLIRRQPEHWLWATRRWRASPGVDPGLYGSRRRRWRPAKQRLA
jgi:KDO2-lipid IV(A) lauroyltransferase